jgi:HlyD family secretion protein
MTQTNLPALPSLADLKTRVIRFAGRAPAPATTDDPDPELKLGWLVVFLFFGLFLGWSLLARLDAAAYAQGSIAVASHRQTVQHRDGGVVQAIHVREGQHVHAGDILIELAPNEVAANEGSLQSQAISLEAERSRLEAERSGLTRVTAPPEFATLTAAEKTQADQALKLQQSELATRLSALGSQKAVLRQREAELSQQITGYEQQIATTDEQSRSIEAELKGIKTLVDKGFASGSRIRALERTASGLAGSRADLAASVAKSRESIGEARMQAIGVETQHAEDVAKQLRDINSQLNDLMPKLINMKTQLSGASIRAPVSGQVVALTVFSTGGVITPGQKLLDIVPDFSPLVIEAQIKPEDAPDLYVGQETQVKFTALHDRNLPIVKGRLTRISADALSDERTGAKYYTAEVTVPAAALAGVRQLRGKSDTLRPGLPVQVLVPLRKRTAFQYLMEPLDQSLWRAFREH